MAREKVILAYSGGLDTSVAVKWINETYNMDVITFTCDLGQGRELDAIKEKAIKTGAVDAIIEDARNLFVDNFVWPSLMAGTMYEGKYPLATALGRPLIAWRMVEAAKEHGAAAVAHGCTGKGNDQVRFDVSVQTLAPHLKVIAPVREWKWTRTEELEYARKHGIEVDATKQSIYSVDQNLWGRSVEAGILENPWIAPPADAYKWTTDPLTAPDEPVEVVIEFDQGRPTHLDGEPMDAVPLIEKLNEIGGANGVGRIDHVENRLVGIKSREIYEAPAAVILHHAHKELEFLTLSRQAQRFNTYVSQTCADIIYDGLWFSAFHKSLMAYVSETQKFVSGHVRVQLYKGKITATGMKSEYSLYSEELATYEEGDKFPHETAIGFIKIHGLSQQTQARQQLLKEEPSMRPARIMPSAEDK
ncbi:Argininosuccinate synthase [Symmachiella macrocystis]|uniref:Argininosuccinate synthase n=1 Tax=Symmachiella macrocystis TaxID=2527985 RepID=A0A5C6BAK8_9PLAN|nr:argininosuccinate synthase [Symmachiella macrocystis]TWU09123.1 Argininosuccinate synthase [Symmachiella macrocystis]